MQQRHNLMTAAGLVVLHNSPARLRNHGRQALAEYERAYLGYRGRGLPPGVELIRTAVTSA
ncbi:MAG: hypothetical protein ACJ735_06765 [Actinomycetes bacterium]